MTLLLPEKSSTSATKVCYKLSSQKDTNGYFVDWSVVDEEKISQDLFMRDREVLQ
jgi:hypothetical protein